MAFTTHATVHCWRLSRCRKTLPAPFVLLLEVASAPVVVAVADYDRAEASAVALARLIGDVGEGSLTPSSSRFLSRHVEAFLHVALVRVVDEASAAERRLTKALGAGGCGV